MLLPDFLVIGAAKSGTTALDHYLQQHPQIFMAEKEPRYFAYDPNGNIGDWHKDYGPDYFKYKSLDEYVRLFADAKPSEVRGEATPLYLESEIAAQNIYNTIPRAKLIAILRNPVDRAISGYMMQVRHGRVDKDVDEAFDVDAHYVQASFYYAQIKRYMDLFPPQQIRIYLFDDFKKNNVRIVQDIFNFVGVDTDFTPNTAEKRNVGSYPKSRALNKILMNRTLHRVVKPITPRWAQNAIYNLRKLNMTKPPSVSEEIREQLRNIFREDILKLQDLIQQDLSIWLDKKSMNEAV